MDTNSQGTFPDFTAERAELQTLLASGIFQRAPSLAQFLGYVCEKLFAGEAGQIKEYNIAVEALGRPADFDQKRDSIVRVEAHRLRKRLKEYYEGAGAAHTVHIVLPPGQYVPVFLQPSHRAAVPAPAPPLPPVSAPTIPRHPAARRLPFALYAAGAAAGLLILAAAFLAARRSPSSLAAGPTLSTVAPPALPADTLRIACGLLTGEYNDRYGQTWLSDRYFESGEAKADPGHLVLGTADQRLYQTRREGIFTYNIPLDPGVYELRLHFAETEYGERNIGGGGESSRIFNVAANGHTLLNMFDVVSDAGANRADIRVFRDISPAADGKLHLAFTGQVRFPFVNAIEITPGLSGRLKPIRIVAQERQYADRLGRVWEADRYFTGGQQILRLGPILGADDPEIFAGERFGNFVYTIPLAAGHYDVALRFSERWFGPNKPEHGGAGSRLFDIYCNGAALVRNFDVFREAGGSDRALVRTFHALQPNAQGKLILALVPSANYASIDAIEVTSTGP